jgi:hypothetical protein
MTHKLYELLALLDASHTHYTLHRTQPDQVTILVTLVSRRIEIYVSGDGAMGYSIFEGDEGVEQDHAALLKLLRGEQ